MRKLVLLVFVLFLTVSVSGQTKNDKKFVNQMTEFLSLTEEESAKILAIKAELRAEIKSGVDGKEANGKARKKVRAILGQERHVKWITHMREMRKKRNEQNNK